MFPVLLKTVEMWPFREVSTQRQLALNMRCYSWWFLSAGKTSEAIRNRTGTKEVVFDAAIGRQLKLYDVPAVCRMTVC